MKAGILGLSLAGKSTLFQLLTGTPAPLPGGRPEPRVGVARVPDPRVHRLAEMFRPKKETLATVEYVDVPGVAKGEGKALVDLPALRGVDVLVHVVRAFASETVPHPDGSVDPRRDAEMLELELVLADLATAERRLERLEANIKKAHKPEDVAERALFLRLKETLEAERPLRESVVGGASSDAFGAGSTAGFFFAMLSSGANGLDAGIRIAARELDRHRRRVEAVRLREDRLLHQNRSLQAVQGHVRHRGGENRQGYIAQAVRGENS